MSAERYTGTKSTPAYTKNHTGMITHKIHRHKKHTGIHTKCFMQVSQYTGMLSHKIHRHRKHTGIQTKPSDCFTSKVTHWQTRKCWVTCLFYSNPTGGVSEYTVKNTPSPATFPRPPLHLLGFGRQDCPGVRTANPCSL